MHHGKASQAREFYGGEVISRKARILTFFFKTQSINFLIMDAYSVLKFGGTSVGSIENLHRIANILSGQTNTIVVVSALSGTTNKLVEMHTKLKQKEGKACKDLLANEFERYQLFIDELFENRLMASLVNEYIDQCFKELEGLVEQQYDHRFEKEILAYGERMSSYIIHHFLNDLGIKNRLLNALDFMRINEHKEPDLNKTTELLLAELYRHQEGGVFLTQGFICRNVEDNIDNLNRGGSDYSATIIGHCAEASKIEIWTDINGLHNNDPRHVQNTYPIEYVTFEEAAELAYFGAKILHPLCIRPAKEKNIPVFLKNTLNPNDFGTMISNQNGSGEPRIKAVASKDGIIAIKIKSGHMLQAYGFLTQVFSIFEKHKTPIDLITTSEVAVSLTIDDTTFLEEIVEELHDLGEVEVDQNQSIICVVGQFVAEEAGIVNEVLQALNRIPIRMISYGGSKNNISLLVNEKDKVLCLRMLSQRLFQNVQMVRR